VPAATPVTTPDVFTVAVAASALLHTPDGVVQASAVVVPLHKLKVPVTGATAVGALTVIIRVAIPVPHVLVTEYVMVTVPAEMPVTTPEVLTVARAVLLLLHTPPGVPLLKAVVSPVQTELLPVIAAGVGIEFTVTTAVTLPVDAL
jgi:hypothetical protein